MTRHCHFLKTKGSGSRVVIFIVTHYCQRHSDIPLRKGRMFQVTVLKINVINFVKNFYGDILLFHYSVPIYYVIFLKYFLSVYGYVFMSRAVKKSKHTSLFKVD